MCDKNDLKINYVYPDFYSYSRNEILMSILENHKEVTREGTSIYSFFGTFPGSIWNGGSDQHTMEPTSIKEMKKVRDFYNKRGIKITFTFTNQLITEEHLDDEYCNNALKVFHNGMNEVLVVSPVLEKYIRENYPKYKINRSIINTEKVPYKLGDYHLSVLSKFKNKDFEFLNKMTEEEKEHAELLCDEHCIDNCPYAYEHYKEHAYFQLYKQFPKGANENYRLCKFPIEDYHRFNKRYFKSSYLITYDDIVSKYIPMGFKYFKLSGRGRYTTGTILKMFDYIFKPKYMHDIYVYMAERMLLDKQEETLYKLRKYPIYSPAIDENNQNMFEKCGII